jgi:xylulokinase
MAQHEPADTDRTPNRPDVIGALHGIRLQNTTAPHLARATVEGLLCGRADGLDALRGNGVDVHRLLLIRGVRAVRRCTPDRTQRAGVPVVVPAPGEYVADGAAGQAAWVLAGIDKSGVTHVMQTGLTKRRTEITERRLTICSTVVYEASEGLVGM